MKLNKILLILAIFAIISVFGMGTSFAASNETIDESNGIYTLNYKNKVINICETFEWDADEGIDEHYYAVGIKKAYNKKNKIKSINVKYSVFEMETGKFKKYVNKKYITVKNNKITFKHPTSNNYIYYIDKLTVKYKVKTKTKSESSTMSNTLSNRWKNTQYLNGKKSNVVLEGTGYGSPRHGHYKTINQKLTIQTKNKKHKIKSVDCLSWGIGSDSKEGNYIRNGGYHTVTKKTFKGNGKNSQTIKLDGTMEYGQLIVYYY